MSTEVFPTAALSDAAFRALPLDGFRWESSAKRGTHWLVRGDCRMAVYIGNGPRRFDRGYRADAVWFEVFGLGCPGNAGAFFADLSDALEAFGIECDFVTELGNTIDRENGVDSDDWDSDNVVSALKAIERAPGSTGGVRLYDHPRPPREVL